jgi:hypothetical protein
MRHTTVQERGEALGRMVDVRATVAYATVIRMSVLLPALGSTRSQAVGEALQDWTLKREQALNREGRLALEKAMRRAMDRAPLEEILASQDLGLTPPTRSASVPIVMGTDHHNGTEEVSILVRLPLDSRDALKVLAAREHRSVAQEMRYLIEQATEGIRETA